MLKLVATVKGILIKRLKQRTLLASVSNPRNEVVRTWERGSPRAVKPLVRGMDFMSAHMTAKALA